jgi:hypothetical protein
MHSLSRDETLVVELSWRLRVALVFRQVVEGEEGLQRLELPTASIVLHLAIYFIPYNK